VHFALLVDGRNEEKPSGPAFRVVKAGTAADVAEICAAPSMASRTMQWAGGETAKAKMQRNEVVKQPGLQIWWLRF
jgi:hypothetical protein